MKKPIQQSRLKIPGRTRVRNTRGCAILCCWDDCEQYGYDEIKIIVREPGKTLHYIFCSEQHKRYHLAGHRTYGNTA